MNNIFARNSIVSNVYPDQRHENVTLCILAKRKGKCYLLHSSTSYSILILLSQVTILQSLEKKTLNCHSFHYHSYNERTLILMIFKNDLYFFPIASSLSLCFVFLPAKSSFSSSCLPFHPFFAPSCYRQLELFLVIHNKDFPLSSDLKLPPCYSFFFFLLNKIKI